MSIIFYNENDSLTLDIKECISLELKLNKNEEYKNTWEDLGDILYSWGSNTNYKNLMSKIKFLVEQKKIDWLRNNISK